MILKITAIEQKNVHVAMKLAMLEAVVKQMNCGANRILQRSLRNAGGLVGSPQRPRRGDAAVAAILVWRNDPRALGCRIFCSAGIAERLVYSVVVEKA